jgi:sensor domain CHASE-containing protein
MTVRRKTVLIIAVTRVGLLIVLYAASRSFLLGGFVKPERTNAEENAQRVLNTLDWDFVAMDQFTVDRAATVESYNAMADTTPEYNGLLLGKDATGLPQTRRFSFAVLIYAASHILASRGLDWATKQIIEAPKSLTAHMELNDPLFQSAALDGKKTTLLLLPEGALLDWDVDRLILKSGTVPVSRRLKYRCEVEGGST